MLVFSALALAACKGRADKAQAVKGRAIPIEAFVARQGSLHPAVIVTGTILANEEVRLYPEIAGQVVGIHFQEGAPIEKGGLLVKLRDDDLQAQLAKLRHNEELAASDEKRKKQLLAIKGISQEEYDKALNLLNTLRADIDLVRAQIARTEIRAPFTGKIGLREVSIGSFVTNNTLIARFIQTEPVKIEFSLPEKMIYALRPGDTVFFTAEGQKDRLTASVYALEPALDISTRTMKVRALYRNEGGTLKPGSYARVEVPLKEGKAGVILPAQALIPEMDGYSVMAMRQGKAARSKVELNARGDSLVEVGNGLTAGDTVLLTGLNQVKEGQPVKVTGIRNGKQKTK